MFLRRLLKQALRKQARSAAEGDEQHAIEQLLHRLDGGAPVEPGAAIRRGEEGEDFIAQLSILLVEFVRDGPQRVVGFDEQRFRVAIEQMLRAEQQHEAAEVVRVIDQAEIEAFIGVPPAAEAIKPQFDAIRDEHPGDARRIDGIFPRLLHRAFAPAWHDGIQVAEGRTLHFQGRNEPIALGIGEAPERGIRGTSADALLEMQGVGLLGIVARVTENGSENVRVKDVADADFLLPGEIGAPGDARILLRGCELALGGLEHGALDRTLKNPGGDKRYTRRPSHRGPWPRATAAVREINPRDQKKIAHEPLI
ncbi:MAG: hypothetical protein IOC82_09055 [Aestuariivirga sp.]|uniref:hypothetical protein n=1 Tax=Aestuariivirga sp. TaxID=2650926 RepID=UPI0025C40FAF|nr:hypothetical protein [Aestuariivirga sp.]MCA3561157.1 hypothetical protein [Aestuariivirga sp.]